MPFVVCGVVLAECEFVTKRQLQYDQVCQKRPIICQKRPICACGVRVCHEKATAIWPGIVSYNIILYYILLYFVLYYIISYVVMCCIVLCSILWMHIVYMCVCIRVSLRVCHEPVQYNTVYVWDILELPCVCAYVCRVCVHMCVSLRVCHEPATPTWPGSPYKGHITHTHTHTHTHTRT